MLTLNTVFIDPSNAMCNNAMFTSSKIADMHEKTERLYSAAAVLRGIEGQSELARVLNVSPQTVNNWEARGVSRQGALTAQRVLGCSAVWIETGEGSMALGPSGLAWSQKEEADRLALRFRGVDKSQFAQKHGVAGGEELILQHIMGNVPLDLESATLYAKAFGVSLSQISQRLHRDGVLATGAEIGTDTPSRTPKVVDTSDGFLPIRRVSLKLSAGAHGYSIEYLDEDSKPIVFRKDWFESNHYNPDQLIALRVHGQSMEPSLFDGDLVVINLADTTPQDGEAFAVNYEGEAVIKRLKRDQGEWWLASDNSDKRRWADKLCTESVRLIGRAVYKQSERV